ncbi:hypothetical protein BD408DRAFT_424976, partial [Parasitella parasitica]
MIGESSKTKQSDSFMNVPNVTASNSDFTAIKPGSKMKSFDEKSRKKVMIMKKNYQKHMETRILQPLY